MKKIYAFALLVVVLAACKDDDPKLTVEQYLTASTNGWVFESIMLTVPGTTTEIDAMKTAPFDESFDEVCEQDDATIFATAGTYTVANNTKCDPDEETIVDSGTWTLNTDKTSLTVDSSDDDPFTLTNLSVNGDHISGQLANFFGLPVNAKVTLKKK